MSLFEEVLERLEVLASEALKIRYLLQQLFFLGLSISVQIAYTVIETLKVIKINLRNLLCFGT